MPNKTQKRRPGRPRNEEITQIEKDLAVTRRRAAQLLKEAKEGSPEFSEKMRELRAMILIQRARLYEAQSEGTELKNAQIRGETLLRKQVHAQGAALANAMSSVISGWERGLPAKLIGQSELELHQIVQDETDRLRQLIRTSVEALAFEK